MNPVPSPFRRLVAGLPMAAVLSALGLLATPAFAAEETNAPLLTLERLFVGSEFGGESASVRWMDEGSGYTTWEKSTGPAGGRDLVRHDAATGATNILVPALELVPPGRSSPLSVEDFAWSKDRSKLLLYTSSRRVWRQNTRGDYWVLDRTAHELFRLGGDAPPSSLMFAKFSPDGSKVAYVRDRNIHVQDLATRRIETLTETPTTNVVNGTSDWVYEEELYVRDGFCWSPDGRWIAFWRFDTEGVPEVPLVNNTAGLYPTIQWVKYPKTGERNSDVRVCTVDLATRKVRTLDLPGDPREHYVFDVEWPEGLSGPFVQQLNRRQDVNRVFVAEADTGKVREVLKDTDAAWVEAHANLKWRPDGKRFVFRSERSGWDHLYLGSFDGRLRKVTPVDFDVAEFLHVDFQAQHVLYLASPTNATQRYLYRTRLDGKGTERLTPADQPGTHAYSVSADGRFALHTWSRIDRPPRFELVSLPDHRVVRVLEDNAKLSAKLDTLRKPKTEFVRIPVEPGLELDAWCLLPPDLDPTKRYPVLFHVYGEPAGSTVRDQWGGSSMLWHWMLAQEGYVVISVDNRGTAAPRGRAWRKSIHRQVGILASKDQAAAARWLLKERPYLDPDRVGVWGWSGGGSMTLNLLLRSPELYKAGISIAPVPNMRLYDTIYQERYMGLPSDNAEGYLQGSPLTHAANLRGELLLIHGTGDDNCHYQGAEAIADAFIAHNRTFRMMPYPNRSHSISEGVGTTRHLRETMTRFLHETLPPGAR